MRLLSSSRALLVSIGLAACGAGTVFAAPATAQPAAAQTPADPVAEAISEASRRFGVPLDWIRAVIRIESAGDRAAVSHAGAMGLMQLMPTTYAELRTRYDLGPNPFAVRDNIMAGAAYLRQMFDRYGSPGFLAAYNAGPGRWEDHLAGRRPLPAETIAYLARLGPMIGFEPIGASSSARRATAPSPHEAPMFARSGDALLAIEPTADQRRALAMLAANRTLMPRPNSLFVPRSTDAITPSPSATSIAVLANSEPIERPVSNASPSNPPHIQDSLFVARASDRGDR